MLSVVDGTECRIQRPKSYYGQRVYYSGKKKHHCLKYNIVVSISSGKILSITGAYPGSTHDIRMWRLWKYKYGGCLKRGEVVLADKAYVSDECCYCLFKRKRGTELSVRRLFFNYVHGRVRFIVEQTIGRIKAFAILRYPFRGELWRHKIFFFMCAKLANLFMGINPIRRTADEFLFFDPRVL